jgi:hypothetical protein
MDRPPRAGIHELDRRSMMKNWNKTTRVVLATLATGGALFAASSAFAQSSPYVMHEGPGPVVSQPHMMPVDVSINIGWHGDRYWDGHRYWAHDDWMHRHPHDPGPQRWHDDDHRPPPPRD